jgi:hypothetical protein
MNEKVFISHAARDASLAGALQDLLDYGLGVPRGDIFRSTHRGDIPSGYNFVNVILDALRTSWCAVILVTPAYLESHFCLAELGAAQMRNLESNGLLHALVVSPISPSKATESVLMGTQVADASYLGDLKARCGRLVSSKRNDDEWRQWEKKYETVLQDVSRAYRMTQRLEDLWLIDLEVAKAGPDQTKIVFKNKLYLTFQNRGTEEAELEACYWDSGSEGVSLERHSLESLKWHHKVGGKWKTRDESLEVVVKPNGIIRTWIPLDQTIDSTAALHKHAARQLGSITLKHKNHATTRIISI